jgi:membrane protein implicated in regulation of membrane protease activity
MLLAWVILGVVLLAVELHHLGFFALFGAVGAFGAAGVAAVAPDAVAAQCVVALAVTAAGVVAVRPYVSRAYDHSRRPHGIRGTHGGLVGGEGVTLDEVGESHGDGHVRLYGERWLAVTGAERSIPAGVAVVVTAVRGTTLVVWPVDLGALEDAGPTRGMDESDEDDAPDGADGRKT